MVFENLNGFISNNGEENRDTFLGACAEYVPVNDLIMEDAQVWSYTDFETMLATLQRNRERSSYLVTNYLKIVDECKKALDSGEMQQLRNAHQEVIDKMHIFGFKPGIKMELVIEPQADGKHPPPPNSWLDFPDC